MSWLFLAVITRFFWATCNLLDQYVSRYFGEDGLFSISILDNLTAALSLPVLFALAGPQGLHLAPHAMLLTVGASFLGMTALFPYMRALHLDDAHSVVPLFELTPVFVMTLAYMVLGESMTPRQCLGAFIIIASGFAFTWDFNHGHLKKKTLALMATAAMIYAVCQLAMRDVTQTEGAFGVAFWFTAGTAFTGLIVAVWRPKCGKRVVTAIRESRGKVFGLTVVNEICSRLAFLSLLGAYARAPTAGHVAAFSGVQPVFVFMLALLLSHIKPVHYKKLVWDRDMKMKMLLLPLILCGAALVRLK